VKKPYTGTSTAVKPFCLWD